MKLSAYVTKINAEVLCGETLLDREIRGGFACDMLSWVMSHLAEGQVWFTVLNSVNVLAIAVLTECACVVLTENVRMDDDVLQRAVEKQIVVLRTSLPTFEACCALSGTEAGDRNAPFL